MDMNLQVFEGIVPFSNVSTPHCVPLESRNSCHLATTEVCVCVAYSRGHHVHCLEILYSANFFVFEDQSLIAKIILQITKFFY